MPKRSKLSDKQKRDKKYNDRYKERVKKWRLAKIYGLTINAFETLLSGQNDSCAVCGSKEPTKRGWFVDHDHSTNNVRGILCHPCNSMLGFARDNPAFLNAGAEYLREQHG